VWSGTDEYGVYEGATIGNSTLIVAGTENGDRSLFGALEKAFVVSALFLFSGGLLTLVREMTGALSDLNQTDPVSQAVFLLVYVITACLVLVWRKRFTRVVKRDTLLWFIIGIALLSVLWSAAPEVTLRRGVALIGTTALGVYVAMRFGLREQLQLLAWALGLGALFSLLFTLAVPAYGIMEDPQGWRGVYAHKNGLGRNMALGALAFMLLALSERRYRWVSWAGFGLSIVLLLLSNSITGLVIFLTLLPLLPLYRATRWPYTLAVPFLIVGVLLLGGLALWGLANEGTVLGFFNRETTFTGRTNVWSAAFDMIQERPWLGYGYQAFWLGWDGPSAYVLIVADFDPLSAHSGYLDLWLNLGLLGVVVFALGFLRAVTRAIYWVRSTKIDEGLWPSAFLTYMLLYNITESAILARNSITWVLYVIVVLSMSRDRAKPPGRLTASASPGFEGEGRAAG
jgi:exopolysaccharide production protein ExoQ